MSKRLVTDQDEIYELILADAAFTEAVDRDEKGVYVMGADGSRRYITQLEMESDEQTIEALKTGDGKGGKI